MASAVMQCGGAKPRANIHETIPAKIVAVIESTPGDPDEQKDF